MTTKKFDSCDNDLVKAITSEKGKSKNEKGLRQLFTDELNDIYHSEKHSVALLEKMIKKSSADVLIDALSEQLQFAERHIKKLEKVFASAGKKSTSEKCKTMESLVKEANRLMEDTSHGMVRDEAIISSVLKIAHYKIAAYGTLCSFANTLAENGASSQLHETLIEQKEADEKFSSIGESMELELIEK